MSSSDTASDTLIVILEGEPIGRVQRTTRGLRLVYDDGYLDAPNATLLSAAMAAPIREHTDRVVTPWLWGLLPDNADVLTRWARQFGVSVASPFRLLTTQVGHDCAGAVQFCRPDHIDELVGRPGTVEPLTERQIADRLRELRADTTSWLGPGFAGQFSLAGAQSKTALTYIDGVGWGLPRGSAPTTHILKPAVVGLDGHDLNEHLCMSAARSCGLAAARTRIERFEDQTAVVVERFDRRAVDGELVRIHQEDLCQALGIHPANKYQSDGGPSPSAITDLFRAVMPPASATEAVNRFVDGLAFNWIIAGTGAHAKNYSLLHAGHQTRLAPLYDIASALPYDSSDGHKLRLAMKVGNHYRLRATDRPSSWRGLADDVGVPFDDVVSRVLELTTLATVAFAEIASDPSVATLASDLPARLTDAVASRADHCSRLLS
jgi:serine/threonine-protein kinase HipA